MASSATQVVLGKNNIEDKTDTYAVIIGNGSTKNSRSNALKIDWSGNIYVGSSSTGVDVSNLPTASFTTVSVGDTNIVADNKADTLTLTAGTGISLTPNNSTNTITISNTGSNLVTWTIGTTLTGDLSNWTRDAEGYEYYSQFYQAIGLSQIYSATLCFDSSDTPSTWNVPAGLDLRVNIGTDHTDNDDNDVAGIVFTVSDPTLIESGISVTVRVIGVASS